MGTRRFFIISTQFDSVNRSGLGEFLFRTMFTGVDYFRVLVSKLLLFLLGSILTYIFSCNEDEFIDKNQSGFLDQIGSSYYKDSKENWPQVYDAEHVDETNAETDYSVLLESSKYQFSPERHFSGFIEEPKSFSIEELFLGSNDSSNCGDCFTDTEKTEESVQNSVSENENTLEKQEDEVEKQEDEEEKTDGEERFFTEFKFLSNYQVPSCVSEELSLPTNSNLEEVLLKEFDLITDDFSGDKELIEEKSGVKDEADDSNDDDAYIELQLDSGIVNSFEDEISSVELLSETEHKFEEQDLFCKETEQDDHMENSSVLTEENHEEKEPNSNYFDDEDEEEEDDILEKLKMEMKNARTGGGLPTIMEECESPMMMAEEMMKPLKLDEKKLEHKDLIMEIHKFYRKYFDKMRKLDILNSQTRHAIGLLQLKEEGQPIEFRKPSVSTIKSFLHRARTREANPKIEFIRELHKDFELVYVGQLCLSWEMLHWQYKKALEIQEHDPHESRRYNKVAAEFQLFQVLLQRFLENEPFQGKPRVENYVNNRGARCNILQVPVIKDDGLKDVKERGGDHNEDAITSSMLINIINEAICVFWEFIRVDKDEMSDMFSRRPELQDYVDSEFFRDVQSDFHKKDKRLKESLRSGSCIVKMLQKHHGYQSKQALLFTQIELRLVSRVLNMSRLTTEQLMWCHEKLTNINFLNKKLILEPSFLLFPC